MKTDTPRTDALAKTAWTRWEMEYHARQLERELNEAQQWIDSEPDWKEKFTLMHQQVAIRLKESQALLRAFRKSMDSNLPFPSSEKLDEAIIKNLPYC